MKVHLLYPTRDFDWNAKLPPHEPYLTQDLELNTLFAAMARDDKFIGQVVRQVVLTGSVDVEEILYRQDILKDCLKNAAMIRSLYSLATEAIERESKSYFGFFMMKYPTSVLHRSMSVMKLFLDLLKRVRSIAEAGTGQFEAAGFRTLFAILKEELDDAFFGRAETHLRELAFQGGVLISAALGKGNKGTEYVLRKPRADQRTWLARFLGPKEPVHILRLHPRDESGARALSELEDRGLNCVANALAQSADHILDFFKMLRTETAFYVGCLNLYEQLTGQGEPITFPAPAASGMRRHDCRGLYDVCLALRLGQKIVGNELSADEKGLVLITGANQGGKSTFLRSIGLAQLMMQCGMFVGAQAFSANMSRGLFTHYKREEDTSMNSGKLDEELSRMSDIASLVTADAMVLFNESFAATNEREGSEIAGQIVRALVEKRVKVFFVTHLYEFSHGLFVERRDDAVFLRAERRSDGGRTFKLMEGEPLTTSFGEDLYRQVFGGDAHDPAVTAITGEEGKADNGSEQ